MTVFKFADYSITVVEKNVTLLPVAAGVKVYPEYIANGALVVDDATGRVVDYGDCTSILSTYANSSAEVGKAPVQSKHPTIPLLRWHPEMR